MKTGVQLERERQARERLRAPEPTPLQRERQRLEAARAAHKLRQQIAHRARRAGTFEGIVAGKRMLRR